jgi:hypothetical protein
MMAFMLGEENRAKPKPITIKLATRTRWGAGSDR